jgi:hypothetical protein
MKHFAFGGRAASSVCSITTAQSEPGVISIGFDPDGTPKYQAARDTRLPVPKSEHREFTAKSLEFTFLYDPELAVMVHPSSHALNSSVIMLCLSAASNCPISGSSRSSDVILIENKMDCILSAYRLIF